MREYDDYLFMCADLYSQGLTGPWGNPLEDEDWEEGEDEEDEEDE